jgi:hypothetical protein
MAKKITVEYLYLDLENCSRCVGTDGVLDEVMMTLTPALQLAGYDIAYQKVMMETSQLAEQYHFLSSPTIRVNGKDIFGAVKENHCGCCGEISGTDVDCRVFEHEGENYEIPPAQMLAEALLKAVFGGAEAGCACGSYVLPENLKAFYEGKKSKAGCGCGCGADCC